MRTLPRVPLPEPAAALDEEARAAPIDEFLSSPFAPDTEEAASIVGHCLDAPFDYGDDALPQNECDELLGRLPIDDPGRSGGGSSSPSLADVSRHCCCGTAQ